MRILGLLPLLLSLTLPLRATLVPGGEKPVTAPTPDVAAFNQTGGRLASDGNSFLAVWIDETAAFIGDVRATRVTPEGKRVDDTPLLVTATDDDESYVGVAYGGGRYLVVWSTPTALRARFVGSDASMSPIIELSVLTEPAQPYVAFNGSRFLVAWNAVTVFRGALIDPTGANVKLFDIGSTAQAGEPALAERVGGFSFVTSVVDFGGVPNSNGYPSSVGFVNIENDGNVAPRVEVAPATTPVFDLRTVSVGNEFVIAWSTAIGIPGGTVRTVRIHPMAIGHETIPTEGMYLQEVGVDASGYFVIYGANDTPKYLHRLGAAQPIVLAAPVGETSVSDVARNNARAFALVSALGRFSGSYRAAMSDLYLTRIDTNEIEPIAVTPRHQASPDVAAAGDLRLAAWVEYVGSDRRVSIVASRLDAGGNTLDAAGIDLHANMQNGFPPRVASNGTDWLVVWWDQAKVFAARIARDGTLLDPTPLVIQSSTDTLFDVGVSWDGTSYVVVFLRGVSFRGLHSTVYAKRVTPQGAILEPTLTLSGDAANELPVIASSNEGSLVVWRSADFLGRTVLQGVLVSRTGVMTPVAFPETAGAGFAPAVAWNGSTYLVAARYGVAPFETEIRWQLVSPTGVVTTPVSSFIESELGWPLEVEAYGNGFLLYWASTTSLFTARLSAQGVLSLPERKQFVSPVDDEFRDRIGASGNMVVYARTIGHPTHDLTRVFARTINIVSGNPRRRAASH